MKAGMHVWELLQHTSASGSRTLAVFVFHFAVWSLESVCFHQRFADSIFELSRQRPGDSSPNR